MDDDVAFSVTNWDAAWRQATAEWRQFVPAIPFDRTDMSVEWIKSRAENIAAAAWTERMRSRG